MISVHFQGKPLNITVIQAYAPASNTEEAEVEWLSNLLEGMLNKGPSVVLGLFSGVLATVQQVLLHFQRS